MQISLDLPRDELVGWIANQLAAGVRNVPPPDSLGDMQAIKRKLERLLALKKQIVTVSRAVSEQASSLFSEEWKNVELKHGLIRAEQKMRRIEYQLACVKNKETEDEITQWGTRIVQLTAPGYDENVVQPSLAAVNRLSSEADQIWEKTYAGMIDAFKRREQEEKLMVRSLAGSDGSDYFLEKLTKAKASLTEDYLHERFLLKKQREYREKTEKLLRERIATLSAELHTVRDLDRVKQVVEESKMSSMHKEIENNERMLEWRLMEEQIRLEREHKELENRYVPKIERMKREAARINELVKAESEFVAEKLCVIDQLKEDINAVRLDVKDIETAISEFRTVLRKDAKLRREQAKVLRE